MREGVKRGPLVVGDMCVLLWVAAGDCHIFVDGWGGFGCVMGCGVMVVEVLW